MENNAYGLTTGESIRTFLEYWPKFKVEFEDSWKSLSVENDLMYPSGSSPFSWCQLYELPIKQHVLLPLIGFLEDDKFKKIFQSFSSSKDQIGSIPKVFSQVDSYFDDADPPSKAEALELMCIVASYFGASLSVFHSLRCVLYHGCFLNELIQRIRSGDDKALYDAIRIDPTVVGCKTVIERISKAALLQDDDFFKKLKCSINGKTRKREQANYQKMRLVLEILHEAKSEKLNDDQLHELFVNTLNLYSWNDKEGGNAKALRKFVDTYMKKKSTT